MNVAAKRLNITHIIHLYRCTEVQKTTQSAQFQGGHQRSVWPSQLAHCVLPNTQNTKFTTFLRMVSALKRTKNKNLTKNTCQYFKKKDFQWKFQHCDENLNYEWMEPIKHFYFDFKVICDNWILTNNKPGTTTNLLVPHHAVQRPHSGAVTKHGLEEGTERIKIGW